MPEKHDEYEIDMLGNPTLFEPQLKHYKQTIQISLDHFYITGTIENNVDKYIDLIHLLKTAEPHDKIYIYLNTPGGNLSTTIQICSAIGASAGEVITVIEGEVCSAGTFIFLAGDNYIVRPNCSFMIHNCSHGTFGKGREVRNQVDFTDRYFNELANSFYKDFLTDEEIQLVCDDSDFWMTSNDVLERLGARVVDEVLCSDPTNDKV